METWQATPEYLADIDRRCKAKYEGPAIKRWQRTMTKEQYLQAKADGASLADIILKYFNNDPKELKKQLMDWDIWEAIHMQESSTLTKAEYLRRRLAGEGRTEILHQSGIANSSFYKLLRKWGIGKVDAEKRELEILQAALSSKESQREAVHIEQKTEENGLSEDPQEQEESCVVEAQDQNVLKVTVDPANSGIEVAEIEELKSKIARSFLVRNVLEERIKELESERNMLLRVVEVAAGEDAGMITLKLPILSVAIANVERARIYEAVEALNNDVEAADIDRERVMQELFDLLQRVVNFITADLAELHPGQDIAGYVREFFSYYNDRHVDVWNEITQQAG